MHAIVSIVILQIIALNTCSAAPANDLVTDLPGLSYTPSFKQYSGYLSADKSGDLQFFYWFVESQQSPSRDPVVLWLNGGPGCSSVDGMVTENGPFLLESDGINLKENPYAWNKITNVLYIESPACVGFSYSKTKNCVANDTSVAEANLEALESFFKLFPEYKANDFYLTGESYGGVYIPSLAVNVVDSHFGFNLKGFAVGNGLIDHKKNFNSDLYYGYYHGIIGNDLWSELLTHCCNQPNCLFTEHMNSSTICTNAVNKASAIMNAGDLNVYDIYQPCQNTSNFPSFKRIAHNVQIERSLKYLLGINNLPTPEPVPCVDDNPAMKYFQNIKVREALHVPDTVQKWFDCTALPYTDVYFDMTPFFKKLYAANIRGLVYNGDCDTVCNFLGAQWFVEALGYQEIDTWKQWMVGKQIGGWRKKFDKLVFNTVRGSGHPVPKDKPQAAYVMFQAFISNTL